MFMAKKPAPETTEGYFARAYSKLALPISGEAALRRAQEGAIHAIGAYFSLPRREPGLVVMPTGSGKTAVILIAPYLLRAKRVLILTPSQLVRSQIAEAAGSLSILKQIGVFPFDIELPSTTEVKSRLSSDEAWKKLEIANIVVATPHCVSPGIKGIAEAPKELFDLVLMDEAHHSEAPRWSEILTHFPGARYLLFTATPFRRDKKELRGKVIYNYPLGLAYKDGVFGQLEFISVEPASGASHDVAIARKAEAVYRKDVKDGFSHRLMVRTDSKKRAHELADIYEKETRLKLAVVHSGYSFRTVRNILKKLASAEIDGIICVAMMGEGFDFPQLKIAAIHSPHKSLAVTLQFIGRFARTAGQKLGSAKFIAIPQDIAAETSELYRESAEWQQIVTNLSATRIDREVRIKNIAASFQPLELKDAEMEDVVMADFKPYYHVKIYELEDEPDFSTLPTFPPGMSILRHEVSEEHNSSLLLLKQLTRPRWTDLNQFALVEHDLVILYYHEESKLLFVNCSRRTLSFYKLFEKHYGNGAAALLSGPHINRVIANLQRPEFFNVGLKNTVQNSNTESYLIKSGPSAQNAISATDGLRYQRGHLFGKGLNEEGKSVTIGYSSSSKVWSNTSARVGELLEWCSALAIKLQTRGPVVTGTPLDSLDAGEESSDLPAGVVGVGWGDAAYRKFPRVKFVLGDSIFEGQLLDCDLRIKVEEQKVAKWHVELNHEVLPSPLLLDFEFDSGRPTFKWSEDRGYKTYILGEHEEVELTEYLSHYPLVFFLEDFSRLEGSTFRRNKNAKIMLQQDQLRSLAWKKQGVDIEEEIAPGGLNLERIHSIQDYLGSTLVGSNAEIVFFDHGSGEIADFITFAMEGDNTLKVTLYHCKGSAGKNPGDRVGDAYEVCGQVSKCLVWLKTKAALRTKISERESSGGSKFLKGTRNQFLNLLADDRPQRLEFEICLVQPGISISAVSQKIGHILGAASDHVSRACGARMILVGSDPGS